MMSHSVSGAIVAGGKAERMDGKEKGLQLFRGQPMVLSVAKPLAVISDSVVINANRYEGLYRDLGLSVLKDLPQYQEIGPLGGVMSCLENTESEYLLISPCDTPCVTVSLFKALYDRSIELPDDIHFVASPKGKHPLHAILPVCSAKAALLSFLESNEKKSVMAFYHYHGCQSLDWHDNELININYLDQLSVLSI